MASRAHSEALGDMMQITGGVLATAYRHFWSEPETPGLLPEFMILMHQITRASVPLMAAAESAARERADRDAVSRALAEFLPSHIEAELNHDSMVLDDLEAIDIRREDVLARIPPPRVAALVGAQYYWLLHHHPVGLLGYVILLEGNPPSETHVQRLQDRSGLPEEFFRSYRLHGELDPTHINNLNGFLDSLPLTPAQQQLLWISAAHTASALAGCLTEIHRECSAASPHLRPRVQ
jgi:hypothetical protein